MNESDMHSVSPDLEAQISSEIRLLLAGKPVGAEFDVEPSSDFCYSLELLIPQLLSKQYSEWEKESLDGIFVARARKAGREAIQIAGTCILISDQTVTPLLVELVLDSQNDSVVHFRVRLGERGGGKLGISGPDCNSREAKQLLATVTTRLNHIRWSYTIEAGGGAAGARHLS